MNQGVAVIIITFNRLELLKKVVDGVKSQTHKAEKIFVVNNSSTDGTEEWLYTQTGLEVIKQSNMGSSGGQYTGFKNAFESGCEWIWTMDDDVVPNNNCLEKLLTAHTNALVRTPLRYTTKGSPFINDTLKLNLTNPFKNIWKIIISNDDLNQDIIKAEGITFEGPLFHRSVVDKIGYPEKKFFIFADDTEYMIRVINSGENIAIIKDARLNRKIDIPEDSSEFTWKHYYMIRNIIAIDILHGNLFIRTLRPWAYLISWLKKSNSLEDMKTVIRAFKDGYFYKSDN